MFRSENEVNGSEFKIEARRAGAFAACELQTTPFPYCRRMMKRKERGMFTKLGCAVLGWAALAGLNTHGINIQNELYATPSQIQAAMLLAFCNFISYLSNAGQLDCHQGQQPPTCSS
jgi:hypothetical protein